MGKGGAFKSDKRRKELMRQKKQEEKRQRRFKKNEGGEEKSEAEPIKETEGSSESMEGAAVS